MEPIHTQQPAAGARRCLARHSEDQAKPRAGRLRFRHETAPPPLRPVRGDRTMPMPQGANPPPWGLAAGLTRRPVVSGLGPCRPPAGCRALAPAAGA